LRRDEELKVVFGAAKEARGGGLCALMDNAREVEVFYEAGELGAFYARDNRGAERADEVGVAYADEEG
jgi:hypothetical protein